MVVFSTVYSSKIMHTKTDLINEDLMATKMCKVGHISRPLLVRPHQCRELS